MTERKDYILRKGIGPGDREAVRKIVESTGFFHPREVDIALELLDETVTKGEQGSGYRFLFLETAGEKSSPGGKESPGETAGYVCYGEIPCTEGRYDIYWIAVSEEHRGKGFGKILMAAAEASVSELGGSMIFLETSSRDQYAPTRNFYLSSGYEEAARIDDYYADGDGLVMFRKRIPRHR